MKEELLRDIRDMLVMLAGMIFFTALVAYGAVVSSGVTAFVGMFGCAVCLADVVRIRNRHPKEETEEGEE